MVAFLLFILKLSCEAKLPDRLPFDEIYEFYKQTESQGVRIKDYGVKGFGYEFTKDVEPGSIVLCIDRSLKLSAYQDYELSTYTKDLDEVTQIKVKVLYHKFMSKTSDYFTLNIKSLSNNFFHFGLWNSFQRELFQNLTLTEFDYDPSGLEEFMQINSTLSEVPGVPKDMLEYESYMWATYVVKSRFFTYNDPEGNYYVMIPILDVPNHYPNPQKYRDCGFFTLTDEEDCLNTFWPRKAGDEFLIQYSIHDSFVFLMGYDMVLDNNPYDYFSFTIPNKKGVEKTFDLYADSTNLGLLELLLNTQDNKIVTEEDFRLTWDYCNSQEEAAIIKALVVYREKVSEYQKTWNQGLRQVRRLQVPDDYITSRIVGYAKSQRLAFYHHIRAVEQDLLYSLHYRLLRV